MSPIPLSSAVNTGTFHITDHSDIDPTVFLSPTPRLTEAVTQKSYSLKLRKFLGASFLSTEIR